VAIRVAKAAVAIIVLCRMVVPLIATLIATSAFAANLPGKGITVKPAQSTISEESFQTLPLIV
jgi:ABC-type proline/glycine betaine transport system substrate-binding protein